MVQHVHDFLQVHKDFATGLVAVLGIAHADFVEENAILDVPGDVAGGDGTVKTVDGAGGVLVRVAFKVPLIARAYVQ